MTILPYHAELHELVQYGLITEAQCKWLAVFQYLTTFLFLLLLLFVLYNF